MPGGHFALGLHLVGSPVARRRGCREGFPAAPLPPRLRQARRGSVQFGVPVTKQPFAVCLTGARARDEVMGNKGIWAPMCSGLLLKRGRQGQGRLEKAVAI
jgi:hypothetical protein